MNRCPDAACAWSPVVMTDDQLMSIEDLRAELLDRVDAQPFEDWSPALGDCSTPAKPEHASGWWIPAAWHSVASGDV
jgi:hypothetical protein